MHISKRCGNEKHLSKCQNKHWWIIFTLTKLWRFIPWPQTDHVKYDLESVTIHVNWFPHDFIVAELDSYYFKCETSRYECCQQWNPNLHTFKVHLIKCICCIVAGDTDALAGRIFLYSLCVFDEAYDWVINNKNTLLIFK